MDVPLQRELSVVKPSRAGIVCLWLWGVSPRQGFVVVEKGFWFFGYQQLGNHMWQDPHSILTEVVAVGQVWVSDVALLALRLFKGTFQREEPFCSSEC